jgi:addiction module RelE/StbE family toxin
MKYSLRVSNAFERQLRRLKPRDRERAWVIIEEIQQDPHVYKSLSGQLSGTRSARAGDLRIIYAVDETEKRVFLLQVGHRERVYE